MNFLFIKSVNNLVYNTIHINNHKCFDKTNYYQINNAKYCVLDILFCSICMYVSVRFGQFFRNIIFLIHFCRYLYNMNNIEILDFK